MSLRLANNSLPALPVLSTFILTSVLQIVVFFHKNAGFPYSDFVLILDKFVSDMLKTQTRHSVFCECVCEFFSASVATFLNIIKYRYLL